MLPLTKMSLSRGLLACPWPAPIPKYFHVSGTGTEPGVPVPQGGSFSHTQSSDFYLDRGPLRKGAGRERDLGTGKALGAHPGGLPGAWAGLLA